MKVQRSEDFIACDHTSSLMYIRSVIRFGSILSIEKINYAAVYLIVLEYLQIL